MPNQRRTPVRRAPVQPRRKRKTSRAQTWFPIVALVTVVAMLIGAVGSAVILDLFNDDPNDNVIEPGDALEDATERTYRADLAANPDDPTVIATLANYLSQTASEGTEWVELYERALAVAPGDAGIRYDFGRDLAATGSSRDAELQLKRVIEMDPGGTYGTLALIELADLYRDWSPPRLDEAIALYQQAAALPDTGVADLANMALIELGVATPAAAAGSPPVASPAAGTPIP